MAADRPSIGRSAVDLFARSPFSRRSLIGIPPATVEPPVIIQSGGQPSIGGIPLAPDNAPAQNGIVNPPGGSPATISEPIYTPGIYGYAVTISIVFAGAGEIMALRKPNTTRTLLLIQNFSVAGLITYCFDRPADNATCIAIGAGGNRNYDVAVPQGELHIFSSGAGAVNIEYMNQDLVNPRF